MLFRSKKMIGWDEVLEPGLSRDAVIQSWRGKEGLKEAASKGYQVILSNGYYIDLCQPAWKHYTNDPVPDQIGLTEEQKKNILGGEATMWSELVTPETIDSRIWPRTAAIAERLWSPREVNNIPDMYERLENISIRLESVGLQHLRNRDMMLRRIVGENDIKPLIKIIELVEPLKDYARHNQGIPYSTALPLTRMPDIAVPDADKARSFRILCEAVVRKNDNAAKIELKKLLKGYIKNEEKVEACAKDNPALESWKEMAEQITAVSKAGLECLDFIERRQVVTDEWTKNTSVVIENARKPIDECELMIVEGVNMLFNHALPK